MTLDHYWRSNSTYETRSESRTCFKPHELAHNQKSLIIKQRMEASAIGKGNQFGKTGESLAQQFELGKQSLRANTTSTGVITSLAVIRRYINELNTNDILRFSFALGAVSEYTKFNHFRSGVLLGQNAKILDWLLVYTDEPFLQTEIVKTVCIIAMTTKFNEAVDTKLKNMWVPKACYILEHVFSKVMNLRTQKSTYSKSVVQLTRLKLDPSDKHENKPRQVQLLEEECMEAATSLYSMLIIERHLEARFFEDRQQIAHTIFFLLTHLAIKFPRLASGDFKTALNDGINKVMRVSIPHLGDEAAIQRMGDLITISLAFQQKTDFAYTLQSHLEKIISLNQTKALVVLKSLLSNQEELNRRVLLYCTKLRSVLFVSTILRHCDKNLSQIFFESGGRDLYLGMLRSVMEKQKIPNIYIFLEDENVLRANIAEKDLHLVTETAKRIINSGIKFQHADKLADFMKSLMRSKNIRDNTKSEYTFISKTFKEKATAEVVIEGLVCKIWKEFNQQNKHLVIEVRDNRNKGTVDIDLNSPGAGSTRSLKSNGSNSLQETMDEETSQKPRSFIRSTKKKYEFNGLHSHEFTKELTTGEIMNVVYAFYCYDIKAKRISLYKNKEVRIVYHRRLYHREDMNFALLEIDNRRDQIVLIAVVYSQHLHKILIRIPLKTIDRHAYGARPYYERDFVTLCTTLGSDSTYNYVIVMLDKKEGINKLLWMPIHDRTGTRELLNFEQIFSAHGVAFDDIRSFSMASGLNTVVVGCRHILAIFKFTEAGFALHSVISEIGFSIGKIRLLEFHSSTFLILGYVAREFSIVNLNNKKVYNFVFEWLKPHQMITEVELDDNLMVYLIEDSKLKRSSLYLCGEDSAEDNILPN